MTCRIGRALFGLVVAGASTGVAAQQTMPAPATQAGTEAADPAAEVGALRSSLVRSEAMIVLDYLTIKVPQEPSIDLLGFHALTKIADWTYLGVGLYAPLFEGEYGGFMAFDATLQLQRPIWGRLFADAGLSIGGGGGGKSKEHSPELSGTGGFVKAYAGLGYDFKDFSLGANIARIKFFQSAIDSTQLNVFVQLPFSYTTGAYASAGQRLSAADTRELSEGSSESTLTLGLDNLFQIDPQGSNTSDIGLVDLQFAHFLTANTYWYASLGAGYRGLRLYNQIIGGLGYRFRVAPSVDLHGQLGVGSGGWAPDRIDTGSGLLVYPKVSAEYAISRDLGLALSVGYLTAPTGSSRNYTAGASLIYHLRTGRDAATTVDDADRPVYQGFRFSLFQQTQFNLEVNDRGEDNIAMLSGQLDVPIADRVYIPIQASVAYNAYLGYPGYGELLAGIGVQSRYERGDRLQFFGQLLVGTNAHGPVLKPGIGVNVGLSDRLALYALAGTTRSISSQNVKFSSDYVGLGLTYRLSVPTW